MPAPAPSAAVPAPSAVVPAPSAGTADRPRGVTSVCSAHPLVLEAAMLQAAADDATLLIEATCNQVNHRGGYTGLTPAAFRERVDHIAERAGFPPEQVVLGGDHLGPSPWRRAPAEMAMEEARAMVAAYVAAGYQKIHLDCSMGCQGEPERLGHAVAAERAARLVVVSEGEAAACPAPPAYVVGTEVPTPGGARHKIEALEVTEPGAVLATVDAHRRAFASVGAAAAFDRVVAVVAQPGVEFDNEAVVVYQPGRARELKDALDQLPGLVLEAHSTDYQPAASLAELVRDGFSILKVGPGLTFAMREALYALDNIAGALDPRWSEHSLVSVMEGEMLARPEHWAAYYQGSPSSQRALRHYSYSDRIRYYWSSPVAEQAVQALFDRLDETGLPLPLVSQFMPALYQRAAAGVVALTAKSLVLEAVRDVLRIYSAACRGTA
ncbi:MAG: D-tagatose-bisphosphate aldolase, class II, non-catalytic subunit [Acidimicrobiales bacterium]